LYLKSGGGKKSASGKRGFFPCPSAWKSRGGRIAGVGELNLPPPSPKPFIGTITLKRRGIKDRGEKIALWNAKRNEIMEVAAALSLKKNRLA